MPNSDCSWEPHLEAYLLGDSNSLTPLYKLAKRSFLRFLSRRAPFMPEDIREEVFDQIFVRLIENPPVYHAAKCSLRALMYGLARNALKQVRAIYVTAGEKTRISSDENEFAAETGGSRPDESMGEDNEFTDPVEQIPSRRWTAGQICAAAEASELLSRLRQDEGRAAGLVFGLECSNTEAASVMKVSRFAVARSLKLALRSTNSRVNVSRKPASRSTSVAA